MSGVYLVPKNTGTYAETLQAVGLASLLEDLGCTEVTVRDDGEAFAVHPQSETSPDLWLAPSAHYPYVWLRDKEPNSPPITLILDYEAERERRDRWRAWKKQVKETRAQTEARSAAGVEPPSPPHPDFQTAAILASMRKGWWSDLHLARWIADHPEETLQWVKHALGVSDESPKKLPSVSNSQMLNPISGKGVHAPKTQIRSPGSVPTQLVDPFSEWMKIRGLWRALLAYRSGDDFKFYVIEPRDIEVAGLQKLRGEISRLNLYGGVRLDIEATLRCAEILIRHSDVFADADEEPIFSLFDKTPREIVSGLRLAYFKSLGTAAALMNDALLPLPDWFKINSVQDARDYIAIIDETLGRRDADGRAPGCLNSLREDHSGDGALLQQYRSWLLSGQLRELLEFHAQFAVHLTQRFAAKQWARPFSTDCLNALLIKGFDMEFNTSDIVTNPGFLSLARAIRNCTIYALRFGKPGAGSRGREVHFGLAQKWKQKMKSGKADLIAAISEFVQEQNWEVTNRLEGKGHIVATEDLNRLFELVDRHGAELVGSLLLAYGYARAPKVGGTEDAPAEDHRAEGGTE